MGRAAAVLDGRTAGARAGAFGVVLAGLVAYDAVASALPNVSLDWDTALTALVLIPATFALVLLALPWRRARGVAAVGLAFAVLAVVLQLAGLSVAANFAKLGAATALAFAFLELFERLSWVVTVAALIPLIDAASVWRGPTRHIVTEEPQVFDALSFAFPVPDSGSFNLGLPDLLFFGVFLAAADRWQLRVGWTWLAMVASFGATMLLTVYVDPFDIGGLPALPLLSVAFLAANADVLWRGLRARSRS